MGKIYFTSDLHFCHDKEFIWKERGFKNVTEMNEAIISNWNSIVQPGDEVYVLGDLIMNDNETGIKLIKQLKGSIHIILGNHDTATRKALYEDCYNVVSVDYALPFKYRGQNFYLSHYPTLTANGDDEKPLKTRVINLCGHTHTKDKWSDMDKGLIYHVEVDAHDCKPVCIETILEEIKNYIEKEKK